MGSLFAAFLGYNPIGVLLGPTGVLDTLPKANAATLTGQQFFPHLISQPFHDGLVVVFAAAAVMMLIGAVASIFDGTSADGADDVSSAAEGERLGEEPQDADQKDAHV